ncbi:MAG: DinB family protein [Bacteroidia bacterium]
MNKSELLNLLLDTQSDTIPYFDLSEVELNKSYGEGKWTVRQILHHLTDVEYLLLGRLKKIIAEPKQVIWAFNQDDWDKAFDYLNEPLRGKKELYSLCRQMNYQLIDKYFDKYKSKEFVHNETGLRSLQDEFEKVALHNQSHIEQIKMALSQ